MLADLAEKFKSNYLKICCAA